MYKGKIPFDECGNQKHYPNDYSRGEVNWVPNEQFEDTMTIVGMERGRSAVYFIMQDELGNRHTMFATDIVGLLKGLQWGGKWEHCKRGMNYGVKLSKE